MQYSIYLVLAAAGLASAVQVCTGTSVEENGNYFCSQTDHLLYDGLGSEGSYKAVTNMGVDGVCSTEDVSYNGGMAPLDQDVSNHTLLVLRLCSNNHSSLSTSVAPSSSRRQLYTTSAPPRRSAMLFRPLMSTRSATAAAMAISICTRRSARTG